MVCPNCGNDCTDAKFCSECGQMLQMAAKEAPEETSASKIPLGTYKGILSSLELGKTGLTVSMTFIVKKTTFIPYKKLTKVLLFRQYKAPNGDYLLFRWEGNDQLPIPAQKDMCLDKTAYCSANSSFLYHVFAMLKYLAPGASFSIENNFNDTYEPSQLESIFSLSSYFKKYSLHRKPAVVQLKKDFRLKRKAAARYIDQYFDWQFEGLYTTDPEKVFQDLVTVVKMLPYAAAAAYDYEPQERSLGGNSGSQNEHAHGRMSGEKGDRFCPGGGRELQTAEKKPVETCASEIPTEKNKEVQVVELPGKEGFCDQAVSLDLEKYYERFHGDRGQAVIALRVDTGMSAVRAHKEINWFFNIYEAGQTGAPKEPEELEKMACPRCGSTNIREKASNGTGVGLFHYRTPVVNLIASIIRFAVIMKKSMEPKKASYICNSCKLIWETEIEK